MSDYLTKLLPDRKNTYEIDAELAVRKILEKGTSYLTEIHRNDEPYDYDLVYYMYNTDKNPFEKRMGGYIEVEVSEHWKDEFPSYWKTFSFLKRKVYEYDYDKHSFTEDLKKNGERTIYLILNKKLTDGCACDIVTISTFEEKKQHVTGDDRLDTFLRAPLDSKDVSFGLHDCLVFIRAFFEGGNDDWKG